MRDLARRGLSFMVGKHPAAAKRPDGGILEGAVSITGAFPVPCDLNPGDLVTVQIATADGEILTGGVCEVTSVGFKPIKVKGFVIGQTRVHKATLGGA